MTYKVNWDNSFSDSYIFARHESGLSVKYFLKANPEIQNIAAAGVRSAAGDSSGFDIFLSQI